MKIIFYRYNNVCEPGMIHALQALSIDVYEIIENKGEHRSAHLSNFENVRISIEREIPQAVFSVNFYPMLAKICHIYGIIYVSYSVDCPVLELFNSSFQYDTNRVFLFDKAQYTMLREYNMGNVFHLPLGGDPGVIAKAMDSYENIQNSDKRFLGGHGISFVGSLYKEKNPYAEIKHELSEYTQGFVDGMLKAQKQIYGYDLCMDVLPQEIAEEIHEKNPTFTGRYEDECIVEVPFLRKLVAVQYFAEYELAQEERKETLNLLALKSPVDLYTNSNALGLDARIHVHKGVKTLQEMPIVFYNSKINLNMTIRPIQTGLPLRVFDICAAGGFLLTNYQEELSDCFEVGKEAESYGSELELLEKVDFYLNHDSERKKIAAAGQNRVLQEHTWKHRMAQILTTAFRRS